MEKYAVTTNIKKAFLHIELDNKDRVLTRLNRLEETLELLCGKTQITFQRRI